MTWARVQGNTSGASSSNASTKSVTLGATVTPGDLVVGTVSFGGSATNQLSTVTDDQGNSYTASLIKLLDSTEPQVVAMFWGLPTNGPKTFTAQLTAGKAFLEIWVDEFSGSDAGTTLTGSALVVQASSGTATDGVKTGSTIGNSGDLIYGQVSDDDTNGVTITKGTGFTQAQNPTPPSGSNTAFCTEWKALTGASDVTFKYSINSRAVVGAMSFSPASGGTTYNDTITESGSASDSYAAAATFAASLTEPGSAADSMAALATFMASVTEAASATDSFSAFMTFAETISESGTASDSYDAVATFEAPYEEAASAGDDYAAAATFIAAFTEEGNATDSLAPNLVIDAVLTEAGSADDVMDAFAVFAADLAEAGSAEDTIDAVATFAAAITEAVNARDAYTASGVQPSTSNIQRITRFARKFNQPLGFE